EEAVSSVGLPIFPVAVAEQPLASVTTNEYGPADTIRGTTLEYGAVPPVAETFTVVVPPKQAIVPFTEEAVSSVGWPIFPVTVAEHPLTSVTTNEYGPADTTCGPSLE